MLLLKNQAINSNLCHLPLIILTTFTVHRDMMRNKHLLGVAPYPHRVLIAATLQKPCAIFVKQWNPWVVLMNVAGPVYPPPKNSEYPSKTKGIFSWNSAYHQSCKKLRTVGGFEWVWHLRMRTKDVLLMEILRQSGMYEPFISTHPLSTLSGYKMLSINRMPERFFSDNLLPQH